MKVVSVSQITGYIKEKLEKDIHLNNIWIQGEISNFKHHSSGHMYFTLKDRTSSLRCIMFRSRAGFLGYSPREGMAVMARGNIAVYERDGQYQLYVEEMQQQGIGALYTAFINLKERLEKEGLFAQSRKRPLPGFPRKIGVITSPTGAAVRDIVTVISRRYPQVHIILIPVAVQGEEAPGQIVEGIRLANSIEGLEVIIVGRGGGSIEELWAFNTESVARSISTSKIPVVSAVGHETDYTIADFVADLRAPTPSAAAEIVVPDLIEIRKQISGLSQRLIRGIRSRVRTFSERADRCMDSKFLKRPKDDLYRKMQDIDYLTKRLNHSMAAIAGEKKNNLALQISRLNDLSPLATLGRGYTICLNEQGKVVNKTEQIIIDEHLEIVLQDGMVNCIVEKIKEGGYDQKKS